MSTCVPTPVSTAFSTVTENSIITTYSLGTSAVPPVVTTRVDPYCQNEAVVLDSAVCLKTGTRTRTETLERTFPSLAIFLSLPFFFGFKSIDIIPISRNLNSFATAAFNDRHGLPHSGMTPAPIPTNYVASTFYARGSVTARLKIQSPRMSSTRFHTKPRSRSPPMFPSAHSTAVALTPPPIPAETVEALTQDPATVRTPVQITLALVSTLGM